MDNRMIDVVIGLALVFALASLLTTALLELLLSVSGLRGKNLQQAITSFLGDDQAFSDAVMAHPLLVSLSRETKDEMGRHPSYIPSDVLVNSLLTLMTNRLAGGVRPGSPAEWMSMLRTAVANPGAAQATPGNAGRGTMALPNADFVDGLGSLLQGAENDWPAFEARVKAWYDAVGERSIGWFKRRTQVWLLVIGLLLAAGLNINPIVIGQRLWNDEALRKATVAAAEQASKAYEQSKPGASSAPSTGTSPATAATGGTGTGTGAAQPPLRVAESTAVETGVARLREDLLDAASQLQRHNTGTGAWQATQRALDAVHQIRPVLDDLRLPDDKSQLALRRFADAHEKLARLLLAVKSNLPSDEAHKSARDHYQALTTAIDAELAALKLPPPTRPSECSSKMDPELRGVCQRLADLRDLQASGLPLGWSWDAFPTVAEDGCRMLDANNQRPAACRGWARLGNAGLMLNLLVSLAGWLMLSIGCSLGAPFWFDLLGKLVKLRGAGGKGDDGQAKADQAAGATNVTTGGVLARSLPGLSASPAVAAEPMSDALNDAERALSADERLRLQRQLGLADAALTGVFDATTRQAIALWQDQNGHQRTGELTAAQITLLLAQTPGDDDGYIG